MSTPSATMGSPSAVIRMTGKDSLVVLHRIGSQNVTDLAAGEARATLFCDFRGRLLHRAWVVRGADDAIWLVRDDAPGASLLEHVDHHVFREDVKLEDLSGDRLVIALPFNLWDNPYGLANRTGSLHMENNAPAAIVDAYGFVLVISPPAARVQADPAFEHARIRAGRPHHGHEIVDRFNPYEIGLAPDVHLSKGCYTGQEALQRLITFESVKRQLAVASGEGAAPAPGDALRVNDHEGAIVTSVITQGSGWLGLAAARRTELEGAMTLPDGRSVILEPLEPGRPLGRS